MYDKNSTFEVAEIVQAVSRWYVMLGYLYDVSS